MTAASSTISKSPGAALTEWLRGATPALLFALRLWASVCLAYYVTFTLQLNDPTWAVTTAAIVCTPVLGASLRKAFFRMIGTVIGAIGIVILAALFRQDRIGFLIGLALWCAVSAFVATLLRNFAAYRRFGHSDTTFAQCQPLHFTEVRGELRTVLDSACPETT